MRLQMYEETLQPWEHQQTQPRQDVPPEHV